MKILDRHILRSHLGPFLLGFSVTTGFLFTQVLRNTLDDFLAKGISPWTMTEVFVLSLGHTIALSVPMSVLVATLMAFGQMAHDNEFTAMKAAGIHLYRILAPVLVAAFLLCIGMVLFNHFVLPESNHRLAGLSVDIARKKPAVDIEPGIIIDDFEGYQILVGNRDEERDLIEDVKIFVLNDNRQPDILVAPRGRLHFEDGGNTLYIDLFDGELHSVPADPEAGEEAVYRITKFKEHTVILHDVARRLERTERKYRSDREMNISMLARNIEDKRRRIAELQERLYDQGRRRFEAKRALLRPGAAATWFESHRKLPPGKLTDGGEARLASTLRIQASSLDSYERQIRSLQVEIHKKFAIPVACLIFVLCGAPLAIRSGRSGAMTAALLSVAIFTIYYLFLTGGEKLADREYIPPWLAMWGANIVLGLLGVVLTQHTVHESTVIDWRRLDPRRWRLRRAGAQA